MPHADRQAGEKLEEKLGRAEWRAGDKKNLLLESNTLKLWSVRIFNQSITLP